MKKLFYIPVAALAIGGLIMSQTASAQEIIVEDPGDAQVIVTSPIIDPIPDVVLAGLQPVYYGGRPCYWYNGAWRYRDAGGWRFYGPGHEPRGLRERREQQRFPQPRHFERARGYRGGRR